MSTSPQKPIFWTVTGLDFGRSIAWARKSGNELSVMIREKLCRHEFRLEDLAETGIPQPDKPSGNAGYYEWLDYYVKLSVHPANAQRVRWPCAKCGKVFFAHCGLDISGRHGRIVPAQQPRA